MAVTIGLVANVYNEVNALPGWLETHTPYFDDVRILHAGPGGNWSDDGTIELLERWRIPTEYCAIDEGFGAVRTRALRMSPCDYVMLLDADERFHRYAQVLHCAGVSDTGEKVDRILGGYSFRGAAIPDWAEIAQLGSGLTVDRDEVYDQGAYLRGLLETVRPDTVATIRRHWHDLAMTRPTQSWKYIPDWQLRLVHNDPAIVFDPGTRMHERLVGIGKIHHADWRCGPFFDHYHFHFKRMECPQRAHDVAIYDAINEGRAPPTTWEFRGKQ